MLSLQIRVKALLSIAFGLALVTPAVADGPGSLQWNGYGGNAQHTAISQIASQPLQRIIWQTPVDLNPPYSGNDLLIHYGSPAITILDSIVLSVKNGATSGYGIESHHASDGSVIWKDTSSWTAPLSGWLPSMGITLLPPKTRGSKINKGSINFYLSPRVAWPESGGRITFRSNSDYAIASKYTVAFYGNAAYAAASSTFDQAIKICTPLTAGPDGSIYFGYSAELSNPSNLSGGLAVVHPNGDCSWTSAAQLSGNDSGIDRVQMNCTPALSADGSKVYVAVASGYSGRGYLCCANAITLDSIAHTPLIDPLNKGNARALSDSTASPMVGPDGSVFMGVFENTYGTNHARGWMLHFSGDLATSYTPGAFGWDDTAAVVPSSIVGSYTGSSPFLILTKYNNYAGTGGNGFNRVAVLDPGASETDPITGIPVMKEVVSLLGQSPDANAVSNGFPGAVREWCVNSVAVDVPNACAIVNSEDGVLYKWNLKTNTIVERIRLTAGIGEAYTPTLIGRDGQVYAINNAILFAIGKLIAD